jgi:hypothetical protein
MSQTTNNLYINFGISDNMIEWVLVYPNVQGIIDNGPDHCMISTTMDTDQIIQFQTDIQNQLIQVVVT